MIQRATPENAEENGDSQAGPADSPAVETSDADLLALIDAWPHLPDAVRAGILAMVRASGGGQ